MAWWKKPATLPLMIVGAALALVAIGAVIWGVMTHEEEGLLEVCWINGQAHYVEGTEIVYGACEGSKELVWPKKQVPLTVATVSSKGETLEPDNDEGSNVQAAITDINRQAGFKILRPGSDVVGADVVVRLGQGVEIRAGARRAVGSTLGASSHTRSVDGSIKCLANISSLASGGSLEYHVTHHELLHCIGLRHDADQFSAIYPLTRDDSLSSRLSQRRITDHDVTLIRTLYKM